MGGRGGHLPNETENLHSIGKISLGQNDNRRFSALVDSHLDHDADRR